VSLNLVDHDQNPLYRVLETVRMEARRWGVAVAETEVYGMVPAAALLNSAAYYLQVAGFDLAQVLELRLLDMMGAEG
jgi:glutamate formiminotransferase